MMYRTIIRMGAAHYDCRTVNTKTGETVTIPLDTLEHSGRTGHLLGSAKRELESLAATLCDVHGIIVRKAKATTHKYRHHRSKRRSEGARVERTAPAIGVMA